MRAGPGPAAPAAPARGEEALRLAAGRRMPAEWERHEATWLTWPHAEEHWPGKFELVPAIWARMVRELETGEDVHVLVADETVERRAREAMAAGGVRGERVRLHRVPNDFAARVLFLFSRNSSGTTATGDLAACPMMRAVLNRPSRSRAAFRSTAKPSPATSDTAFTQ